MPLTEKAKEDIKNSKVNIHKENMQRIIKFYALSPCSATKMAEKFSLSISRMSIILRDDNVKAEIDKLREENFEEASMKFQLLANRSVEVVADAVNHTDADVKIAMKVLEGLGIANPKVITVPIKVEVISPDKD